MFKKEVKGERGEELVFVIPDATVNHATHIHVSALEGGNNFILESVCVLPVIFNRTPSENLNNATGELKIGIDEVPPFSRVLVSKKTLEDLVKTLKSLGVDA